MIDKIIDFMRGRRAPYLLGASALAYYSCFLFQELWLGRDPAIYFLLGRSLAQGAGYVDLFRVPIAPHTYYPPGYPFILSLVMRLCGEKLVYLRIASLLLTGISLAVLIRLLSAYLSPKKVTLIVAVFAFNPLLLNFTHTINSEVPYFLFSWLALSFFIKKDESRSWAKVITGALFAIVAFYMRSAGFALCASITLYLVLKRKYLQAVVASSIMFLSALPWLLCIFKNTDGTYLQTIMHKDYYTASLGTMRMWDVPLRFMSNGKYYIGKVTSDLVLFPFLYGVTFGNAFFLSKILLSASFSFLFLRGFFVSLRRGLRIIELYIALYVAVLFLHSFHSERFLLPLYPFLIGYSIIGLRAASSRLSNAAVCVGICGWLLVSNVAAVERYYSRLNSNAVSFQAACAWMKNAIPDDAQVMAIDFAGVYLYAHRMTLGWGLVPDNAPASFEALREKKVGYLVIEKDAGLTLRGRKVSEFERYIRPIEKQYPGTLKLVYEGKYEPCILIYKVNMP